MNFIDNIVAELEELDTHGTLFGCSEEVPSDEFQETICSGIFLSCARITIYINYHILTSLVMNVDSTFL